MAAVSSTRHGPSSGSESASWISPKRRQRPSPIRASDTVDCSRDSGAARTFGTFGKADRFSNKAPSGAPNGKEYYVRNQTGSMPMNAGKTCTQGIGHRPKCEAYPLASPKVGPADYSADRPDTKLKCSMHRALGSTLVPRHALVSPGPHAGYHVRRDLDAHFPRHKKEPMSHGTRHAFKEDTDGPGPGHYDHTARTIGVTASCPNLHSNTSTNARTAAAGVKPKCTFGSVRPSGCSTTSTGSAAGSVYYQYVRWPSAEDYLQNGKSCSFGSDKKTDFANPFRYSKSHRSQVAPTTYKPRASPGAKSSALDGFVPRQPSPVATVSRRMRTSKMVGSPRLGGSSEWLEGSSTPHDGRGGVDDSGRGRWSRTGGTWASRADAVLGATEGEAAAKGLGNTTVVEDGGGAFFMTES
eukprot:TRINITY_DN74316_c0_g1_i1.p1 TRINITY_DN74316_c0_g1~~TRINITY_DN74316_c0_g1_i1.p1  ORF type:complete len:411 (-),score=13.65 TRINITY_DN74316_c0_g1_i1:207-1439(-)